MTQIMRTPLNEEIANAVWPTFIKNVVDKHGSAGSIGNRGEQNAIELLKNEFNPKAIIDHSEDPIMQLLGIDLTVVMYDGIMTIDVKSGRTALYYDSRNKRWFLSIKEEWFLPSKRNEYIMNVGPKGDRYCLYKKDQMYDYYKMNEGKFTHGRYALELDKRDWPNWIRHNFTGW